MSQFPVTQYEQWIIEAIRKERRDSAGRPFNIIIRHPGGNAPFQIMRAEVIAPQNGKVDTSNERH